MPAGFGVSTETARSVVKNFKKQRRFYNAPEDTVIRIGDKVSDKSEINISNKKQLFESVNGGTIWTSKVPNKVSIFDVVCAIQSTRARPGGRSLLPVAAGAPCSATRVLLPSFRSRSPLPMPFSPSLHDELALQL